MGTKQILHDVNHTTQRLMIRSTGGVAKTVLHSWGAWGTVIAGAVFAWLSKEQLEHDKKTITTAYENEIAARRKIRPEDVTVEDMQEVAKENPAIKEAWTVAGKKAWLNFGVNSAVMLGAAMLGAAVAFVVVPHLGLAAAAAVTAKLLISAAVAFAGFVVAEPPLEQFTKQQLGLTEPDPAQIESNPSLQAHLNVPSQVKFLGRLRNRNHLISQEQVFTVFTTANPELANEVKSRYGSKFSELPPEKREQALLELGPRYDIEGITSRLNEKKRECNELAFSVYGQESGVPERETPHVTMLEKANAELHQRYAMMQKQVETLSAQTKEQAAALAGKIQDGAHQLAGRGQEMLDAAKKKLPFHKPTTSGVVADNQAAAKEALAAQGADSHVTAPGSFSAREQRPAASKTEQLAAQRRQGGQQVVMA